jgi:hypothetical protein
MNVYAHRYRALHVCLLACAALLAWRQQALGLATEHFGNAPVPVSFSTFTADLLAILNHPARVYWYEVNGDASFYYKGDMGALNDLLKRFAAKGKGREVVLHAGPLKLTNLGGTRRIDAHWYVHVPGGISLSHYPDGGLVTDKGPAIHLYLPAARVTAATPAATIAGWIADLDSDVFAVRERGSQELEKQGAGAAPALRKALETTSSAEVRKRIRSLLARLPALNLDLLVVPEGMTVVGPDDLRTRCTRGLKSKEYVIRGVAAAQLARLEPDRKMAVEGLLTVLKEDKHEYVRRSVAGALQREGWWARVALPTLRASLGDPDVNVRNAFKAAVTAIEKAKEEPGGQEQCKRQRAIQNDIAAYLKARHAKASPYRRD